MLHLYKARYSITYSKFFSKAFLARNLFIAIIFLQRTSKSAEPDMRPNLPVLYNKYAEDLVNISTIREVEHDDEEPKPRHSSRMSRNRSVPPEAVSLVVLKHLARNLLCMISLLNFSGEAQARGSLGLLG